MEQATSQVMSSLSDWYHKMAVTSRHDENQMMAVLREGGPFHSRGELPTYLERLAAAGHGRHCETLRDSASDTPGR